MWITDAGEVYYIETARQILDLEYQMKNPLSNIIWNRTGSLIIGAAPYRAASMMPIITKQLQSIRPSMHHIVREDTTAELVIGVVNHGGASSAFTRHRLAQIIMERLN